MFAYDRSMAKKRSWTDVELRSAVEGSKSYRVTLIKLRLVPAGGNYVQIKRRIVELSIPTEHFTGMGWNVGLQFKPKQAIPLELLLLQNSHVQSHKLKMKLFTAGLKLPMCEICGWREKTVVEING